MTELYCALTHHAFDDNAIATKRTLSSTLSQCKAIDGQTSALCASNTDVYQDETLLVTIAGYPHWPDLKHHAQSQALGHSTVVASLWKEKGEEFLSSLHGSFVLAIVDTRNRILFAALDRIGTYQLYYALDAEGCVVSTILNALVSHSKRKPKISKQALYEYLYFHMIPSPLCVYDQVSKLREGQYLLVKEQQAKVARYWFPPFCEDRVDLATLATESQNLLRNSVKRYCDSDRIGTFLSGGLDSSTVTGLFAQEAQGNAQAFSIGFNIPTYNEIDYARIAAKHFGVTHHEYYVTPEDTVRMVEKIADSYEEPFGNSSALPVYYCAKFAKEHGIARLLAGDGGDEIYGGNERYVKQLVFQRYLQLPAPLRNNLITPLFRAMSFLDTTTLTRKARSYIMQASTPLPDRLESYNFLHRHHVEEIFSHDLLRDIDVSAPLERLRAVYREPEGNTSDLNRMLYLDWYRTLHDNDLVKVNHMCKLAGVEVVYPMLDDDVVVQSCRIPSTMKIHDGKLRWFYKRAYENFLPTEIINKPKHGFGLPFGVWITTEPQLRDLAYSSVTDLKQRSFFREDFLDRTIQLHQQAHAGYYGELVWILMMLELWLKQHRVA